MHELAELISSLAWPVTVIISVFILRNELRTFVRNLTDSVSRAARISIGAKGLDIKLGTKIAAVNTRITAVQATQELIKPKSSRRRSPSSAAPTRDIPNELRALASEYAESDAIANLKERVRRKNEVAAEMGDVALSCGVAREALLASGDEIMIAAFASMVIAEPRSGDLGLLLEAPPRAKRLHVRYRAVLALTVLINQGFVEEGDRTRIMAALDLFGRRADPALSQLVEDTTDLLTVILSGDVSPELGVS